MDPSLLTKAKNLTSESKIAPSITAFKMKEQKIRYSKKKMTISKRSRRNKGKNKKETNLKKK